MQRIRTLLDVLPIALWISSTAGIDGISQMGHWCGFSFHMLRETRRCGIERWSKIARRTEICVFL